MIYNDKVAMRQKAYKQHIKYGSLAQLGSRVKKLPQWASFSESECEALCRTGRAHDF